MRNKVQYHKSYEEATERGTADIETGYSITFAEPAKRFGFECLLPENSVLKSRKPSSPEECDVFDLQSICDHFLHLVCEYGFVSVYSIKTALGFWDVELERTISMEDHRMGYSDVDFFVLKRCPGGLTFTVLKDPVKIG